MLDDTLIVGITIFITERIKEFGLPKQWIPLAVLLLAGALNVGNAMLFAPDTPWREVLYSGLVLGGLAGGIYGLGKAALGKS